MMIIEEITFLTWALGRLGTYLLSYIQSYSIFIDWYILQATSYHNQLCRIIHRMILARYCLKPMYPFLSAPFSARKTSSSSLDYDPIFVTRREFQQQIQRHNNLRLIPLFSKHYTLRRDRNVFLYKREMKRYKFWLHEFHNPHSPQWLSRYRKLFTNFPTYQNRSTKTTITLFLLLSWMIFLVLGLILEQKSLNNIGNIVFTENELAELEREILQYHTIYYSESFNNGRTFLRMVGSNIPDKECTFYGNINNLAAFLEQIQSKAGVQKRIVLKDETYFTNFFIPKSLVSLVTTFLLMVLFYKIFTKTSPDKILSRFGGKKSFKVQSTKKITIRFKDVAGMEQAKLEVTEFVDFLKNSAKYSKMGANIPKGALLTGPPGTGKTMLAKACAGEAGVSFFYISGSQFVQVFVGLGASKVRDLFARARQEAPSIIFIDQIDAIGRKRESSRNEQKDSTLNQLLVQMDGFSTSQTIIILAATNRKDILDSALTRPGRFDRTVEIGLPDLKARGQIFMVHLKPLKIDPQKTIDSIAKRLAELTPGFSGADISNLCNQAAILATRRNLQFITEKDFEDAAERVIAGYQKKSLVTKQTKNRVAHHEAGHAVCGWFLEGGEQLVKLTIIPRSKGALGYAQYLPKQSFLKTKDQMIDQIAIMMGGITSEQIFFGEISTGGSNDLEKVYSLVRDMIVSYGMGEETYNITLNEQAYVRKESEALASKVDQEMMKIVDQASKRCKQTLEKHKDIIAALANQLLEKETINSDDILRIMGPRPDFQKQAVQK